jgi:hypothetical protein
MDKYKVQWDQGVIEKGCRYSCQLEEAVCFALAHTFHEELSNLHNLLICEQPVLTLSVLLLVIAKLLKNASIHTCHLSHPLIVVGF